MAVLSLNSNIASALTQRRLAQTTSELNSVYNRLSSGLRINRASDDAAGLSLAANLNADTRVYGQAIRNVNDAISLSRVAQGAMGELSNIVTRIAELAEQSANGTMSYAQRSSLDKEAQSLKKEYNRIVDATEFNGLRLFDPANDEIRIMAGYDAVDLALSALSTSSAGDGTFKAGTTINAGVSNDSISVADVNGDGITDLITSGGTATAIHVALGVGDGTFKTGHNYGNGSGVQETAVGDANGDGIIDLFGVGYGGAGLTTFLGNGDGSFRVSAVNSLGLSAVPLSIDAADVNGDGRSDLAITDSAGQARVMFGNSDGSFALGSLVTVAAGALDARIVDINGDGKNDIVSIGTSGLSVNFGAGNGTFASAVNYTDANGVAVTSQRMSIGDIDNDGALDVVLANNSGNSVDIFLNNGNGTFKAVRTLASYPGARTVTASDINGDGNLDLVGGESASGTGFLVLGNGDGTFLARSTFAVATNMRDVKATDLNGDGSKDLVYGVSLLATGALVLLGNTDTNEKLQYFSLRTQDEALEALTIAKNAIANVARSMGTIGASESRLDTMLSGIYQMRENTSAAASRIQDADIADEAGRLTRLRILQQSGAAILAQANMAPKLALKLLKDT